MAIQGLRNTTNWATDERPKNWRSGLLLLDPNGSAPLTALTSAMKGQSSTDDPEFNWWDKQLQTRRLTLTADVATAASTTLTVSGNAKSVKKGDILYSEQNTEQMRVTADPSSETSITVSRGFAGTTAAAITYDGAGINPNFLIIGSANEEGSVAPTGVNFDPTKRYNFTQIFRNTLEMTRTASKTRLRTTAAVAEAKREAFQLHTMDMERAFWLGKRSETTENGNPLRTTDGFASVVASANIKDANSDYASGLTMLGLEEYMYEIFKFGSNEKVGFCGLRSLLTLQQVLRKNSSWHVQSGISEFGMNVSKITSQYGTIVLKSHPLFNYVGGGTTGGTAYYGMESWMAVVDMAELKYRYVDDTMYETDYQSNGLDGKKSGFLTEAGLEIHHPSSHYLIKNIVSAAADA